MSCVEEIQEIPSSSSNEILAAATREAAFLSDREREIILGVLTKDEQLRRQQQIKIMHLKAELQNLRRKGALKVSTDWDSTGPDPDRSCGRCRVELGRVINRGAYCRTCRLKVCKGCREYNFRATDWVCTVCYKRMEIQAASGEWMNEFVRRPSRRRDTRVYVPAADIIKRTIRRSWTISNPTPRWTSLRNSPELRPYNSLPRGQDINDYPSLALHQKNLRTTESTIDAVKQSPTRRAKSEDVYAERGINPPCISDFNDEVTARNIHNEPLNSEQIPKRPTRINPLMSVSLRESKENRERRKSPRRKTEAVLKLGENASKSPQIEKDDSMDSPKNYPESQKQDENKEKHTERHVSFDNAKTSDLAYFRSRSLSQSKSSREVKKIPFSTRSLPENGYMKDETPENAENTIVELCDIEPLSGTVFRKMTVRRRRQENLRKMPAVDSGWRRPPETDLFDILLPDGEDYRLVFVNSDSSSKEEDVDDNDSSSASSFPIDDCDWDYFEPGVSRPPQQVLGWGSPFGSPRVYRKRLIDSPLSSPLLQRRPRIRESSDEDISSPFPSETQAHPRTPPQTIVEPVEAMHCVHQSTIGQQTDPTRYLVTCKTCGGCASTPAHYIPVPVPIPIPFPVPWGSALPITTPNNLIPLYKSLPNLPRAGTNAQASDFWQFFAQVPGFPWGAIFDKPMIDEKVAENNEDKEDVDKEDRNNRGEEEEPRGHLECENRGSSASESSSTDSSDDEENQPRIRRVYNVTGSPNDRESDDALPSSNVTTDNEDEIDHRSSADEKEREEEEETSSGSADTDSNDTGTVADQKPKRFSRVFVVNRKGSSSSSSASVTSSSGNTDSSDNDTDTELDCTVILTNIKQIDYEDGSANDNTNANEEDESGKASFLSMRYIGEDKNDQNCDKVSEEALASTSSEKTQNCETPKDGCSRKTRGRGRKGNRKNKRKQEGESNIVQHDGMTGHASKYGCDKVLEQDEAKESIKAKDAWDDDRESLNKEKHNKVPKNDAKHTKEDYKGNMNNNFEYNLEDITKFISAEAEHSALLHISKLTWNNGKKANVEANYCLSNADQIDCDKNDNDTIEKEDMILDNESIKVNEEELIRQDNKETGEKLPCLNDIDTYTKDNDNPLKETLELESTFCNVNLSSLLSSNSDQLTDKPHSIDTILVNSENIKGNIAEVLDNDSPQNDHNNGDNDTKQDEFTSSKIGEHKTSAVEGDKSEPTNATLAEVNDTLDEPCESTNLSLSSVLNSAINEVGDKEWPNSSEDKGKDVKETLDEAANNNMDGITTVKDSTFNTGLSGNNLESNVGEVIKIGASDPIVIGKAVTSDGETKKNSVSEGKSAYETYVDDLQSKYRTDYTYSSSPGLSDVSAESLSSSDVEKESSRSRKELEWGLTKTDVSSVKNATKTKNLFAARNRDDVRRDALRKRETDDLPGACSNNHTGVLPVNGEHSQVNSRNAAGAKYTSLVMITNDLNDATYQQVSVVTSDTTKVVPGENQVVVVSHTNRQDEPPMDKGREHGHSPQPHKESNVTVITSAETLSAFEEGLADDDSWVENLSYDDDDDDNDDDDDDDDFPTNSISENSSSGDEVTLTCSAAVDQEDELRGYHRAAIDFTLHTIVEESCEESEVEQAPLRIKKERPASATDLEKYFFFGLGDGTIPSINSNREDAYSETSSIYSEGMESLGGTEDIQNDCPEELASSRLEKYFLSGFMGFTAERRDSDGSVGSDSEGKPSPEQRRKRLVRARGTGRSHSNSLDNLLGNPDLAGSEQHLEAQNNSEDSSSSDSDTYDDILGFEKSDGQFDTVKRKKTKKQKASLEDIKNLGTTQEEQEGRDSDEEDDRNKTPQPEVLSMPSNLTTNKNQQSRDSGFVGSCDDLLKDQRDINKSPDIMLQHEKISENILGEKREEILMTESFPPATNLTRKDSFNNWSSDEETNLMMSKMRQFFKTMVANSSSSKPTTPNLSARTSPKPFPRMKTRCKPPQLVYFENELTRLMKTVPGIRDDQVREIVEYLSSEDTWSDSYDSSDYTSSDLECASTKSALQQQISDSCKQIINKFDVSAEDEEGDAGDGGIIDESHGLNKETAFVYQKLVASFEKMATEDHPASTSGPNSPPLIAKVMHHIGSRLVALMHEVSSGESHASNSPKARNYHRRLQQKLSNASSTTTDDDSTSDTNLPDTFVEGSLTNYHNMLPRSRSHDLLMADGNKNLNQSISGVSEISEEREASDCERFSWRGSFESALLATDSRNRLSLIGGEGSASASALAIAAKRRSAGDLLFSHKSLSREQLDRVRSCGSIGGGNSEDKLWVATATKPNRRRSSVPDAASCGSGASADGEDEDEEMENRATLPRSMQSGPQTTNSLPRLPTTSVGAMQKAQSHHFLPQNVKSARYRPPGFSRLMPTQPKRAVSAPGLQPSHQRRGRRSQQSNVPSDDVSLSEAHSSPMLASRTSTKSATPSPVAPSSRRKTGSVSSQEWPTHEDDIDRLVAMHHNRSSLSSLGLRSDSMASVYSGAGEGRYGTVTVRGQVEFGLQYNYKAGALEVQIKQCKDLAPVDVKRNRSDPYVKVYLLPDKSKSGKRKTKVKKHTLNPVFDECLKFHMSLNELEIRTLWLSVWHSDMFGRNDFLGEVMMTLENKVFDDPTPKWYNLQERTEPFDDMLSFKGDIIVCLKFVPPDMTVHKKGKRSRGALHVLVKEAKALTAVKAHGSSDPFCKSYLLPDKGRSSKQKTPVVKRTVNPVWNYTFIYDDVTLQELAERSLELTVWDHDRLASNEFLGMVRFSLGTGKHHGKPVEWMDATGKELGLWKSMLERPNFWVEGCLSLRSTLVNTRVT